MSMTLFHALCIFFLLTVAPSALNIVKCTPALSPHPTATFMLNALLFLSFLKGIQIIGSSSHGARSLRRLQFYPTPPSFNQPDHARLQQAL